MGIGALFIYQVLPRCFRWLIPLPRCRFMASPTKEDTKEERKINRQKSCDLHVFCGSYFFICGTYILQFFWD